MKDFLGQKLEIGDDVVYTMAGYKSLQRGTVIKFCKKMVEIERSDKKERKHEYPGQTVKIANLGNLQ
jgi:hypothetical protein